MKSNINLVLFAVYFFGLHISGIRSGIEFVPQSILNLHKHFYLSTLVKCLRTELMTNEEYLDNLKSELAEAAHTARITIQAGDIEGGRVSLYSSIKEKIIDDPELCTEQAANDLFAGGLEEVKRHIRFIVNLFVQDVRGGL
ncbi:uncharacterized protein LOC126840619 isoform X2 [Adelges cooleyi]|nr:uncharacterized protein LOC126840619 isoform X2 [Adelges cooleyi]